MDYWHGHLHKKCNSCVVCIVHIQEMPSFSGIYSLRLAFKSYTIGGQVFQKRIRCWSGAENGENWRHLLDHHLRFSKGCTCKVNLRMHFPRINTNHLWEILSSLAFSSDENYRTHSNRMQPRENVLQPTRTSFSNHRLPSCSIRASFFYHKRIL